LFEFFITAVSSAVILIQSIGRLGASHGFGASISNSICRRNALFRTTRLAGGHSCSSARLTIRDGVVRRFDILDAHRCRRAGVSILV
jgi:hypothetical protein